MGALVPGPLTSDPAFTLAVGSGLLGGQWLVYAQHQQPYVQLVNTAPSLCGTIASSASCIETTRS